MSSTGHAEGLRAMTRTVLREQFSVIAVDLFTEHGFDSVTVEQVASASGISTRSMHRYFASKEDMVIGVPEANGPFVRDAFAATASSEPVLTSLYGAFAALLTSREQNEHDRKAMRLLARTPSLQARNLEKHMLWSDLLLPLVATRLRGGDAELRGRVLIHASLSAFTLALTTWGEQAEDRPLGEFLEAAFRDLRH